ncbi:MAG: hypothetical protein JWP81_1211 [Ferruginibacter sp.]|nr:hypothetical protein [Ferruginibacter sp.]
MKNILKSIPVILLLLLGSKLTNAQDYRFYQAFDAVMLQISGDTSIECMLKKGIIVLSNNSSRLNVRINIPYPSINYIPGDTTVLSAEGLPFELSMPVNSWMIQDELTSAKVVDSWGFVTMNNITKAVKVQYIPLPAGTEQDGNFNLSIIIQFNPRDFNLDEQYKNSQIIIKISDATVNRV